MTTNPRRILSAMAALLSGLCLHAASATGSGDDGILLRNLDGRNFAVSQGNSFGVPFPKGTVRPDDVFTVTDLDGSEIETASWPLAYWPDGSLKWLGIANVAPETGAADLLLKVSRPSRRARSGTDARVVRGLAEETADGIFVDTGVMQCLFPSSGTSVIKDMRYGGRTIVSDARLVMSLEKRPGGGTASVNENFAGSVERLTLLQDNGLRTVIKVEGRHRGADSGREWLPFSLYCTLYKGMPTVSVTYSFLYDSDGREDFIDGLGLALDVPFRDEVHNRHVRFSGSGEDGAGFWCQPVRLAPGYRPSAGRVFFDNYGEYLRGRALPSSDELSPNERAALGTCPVWSDMRLVQNNPNSFSIDKRTGPASSWVHVNDGGRSLGAALLGDTSGSVFLGVKDFWQSYPACMSVDNAGSGCGTLTAWLWSPSAEAMDMRHYDTSGHDLKINYEDYKEGWESPYGVGHRSSLEIRLFDSIPDNGFLMEVARAVQKPVQYSCTPEYFYSVKAFGHYWGLPDYGKYAHIEKQLDDMLDFYRGQVDERSWYGFWNYGDIMHNFDFTRHDWRYDIGGWAWNNIELAPNVLLWTCFLRTGREDIWSMAEAMEKHSSEVDVHHIGRFAPLGTRHNVTHWGDGCKQPRIEYAAMKRYMYYLTGGDPLTGDRMSEQLGSEKAYDYARRVSTWGAVSGTYLKSSLNDWAYYAGNWMMEWERTGNPYWGERLLNSMRDIVALGRESGRLVFDYFNTDTGRFMVYLNEDPEFKGTVDAPESDFVPASSLGRGRLSKIVGYRVSKVRGDTFSTLFGAPELLTDMKATVDYPEFWAMVDNSFRDVSGSRGGNMTGPRMAAWVANSCSDADMGALAWKNLLDNGRTDTESDGTPVRPHDVKVSGPDVMKAVSEPYFLGREAGWQRHTPSTTQWLLNAIEVMEWADPYFGDF